MLSIPVLYILLAIGAALSIDYYSAALSYIGVTAHA
jgi:hypothetical protein